MPFYRPSVPAGRKPYDETSQRALNTPYTNDYGCEIWCVVGVNSTQSGDAIATVDGVDIYGSGSPSTDVSIAVFPVPEGAQFSVRETAGVPTLVSWVTYRP